MNLLAKIPCSVEILTRNSAETLEKCLESVKNFAEIIILDGNSTDNTREIAARYGCQIIKQYDTAEPNVTIKDYSEVRNKGLRLATYYWFMYIDSDEYLSPEAAEEIRAIVNDPKPSAQIFWQKRRYVLDGKVVDCATTYPSQQIRFFHRDAVKEFIKPVHERIEINPGAAVGTLKNLEYVPLGSLALLKDRWHRYILIEEKMLEGAGRKKLIRLILRQGGLLLFYLGRYVRNLFFCHGFRMPLRYEITRHFYTANLAIRLIRKLIWN